MIDIPPNFGVKKFETEKEAIEYLQRLSFRKTVERSDYDVYETGEEPKKRATVYQDKDGKYFVGLHVEKK